MNIKILLNSDVLRSLIELSFWINGDFEAYRNLRAMDRETFQFRELNFALCNGINTLHDFESKVLLEREEGYVWPLDSYARRNISNDEIDVDFILLK
jgi:hypothetical protein